MNVETPLFPKLLTSHFQVVSKPHDLFLKQRDTLWSLILFIQNNMHGFESTLFHFKTQRAVSILATHFFIPPS